MFVRPEEVIKEFDLEPGMTVADFGCGSGHYTVAAAKRVGEKGRVYALDIQKDLLQAVKSAAEFNNLKNIEITWADLDLPQGSRLADKSVDFAIISNILFQAEKREQIAKEALRILKDGGRVAVIEWAAEGEPRQGREKIGKTGPAPEKRVAKEEAGKIFLEQGFKLEKEFQPGDNHYGLIFKKQ
ncbi:MAG: methyltransferase domain-containing protein [Candidatus Parcubacteria bacterium]|nr:methyltransferase domain-containing protein [Candidatus Parcubacteria bacterium]